MRKFSFLLAALSVLVSGCDDGSSNSTPAPVYMEVTGKISDPAVEGAKIELYGKDGKILAQCGANGNTLCNVWSKEDGTFRFIFPENTKILPDYYMKTTGGTDSKYGYEINYSLLKQLKKDSKSNIIISPVTSLIYEVNKTTGNLVKAESIVSKSLGIKESDLNKDPETNTEILKTSYIINTLITVDNSDNVKAVSDIASKITNGEELLSDAVLSQLIKPEKLLEVKSVISSLNEISNTSRPDQAINTIKQSEKKRMFAKNIMDLTLQSTITANVEKNIVILIDTIEKQLNNKSGIPLDSFITGQLVQYVASLDKGTLSKYADYDTDSALFKSKLDKALQSAPAFKSEVTAIISEKIYNINVPLDKPLAMDNNARINYYFNSTKDLNYKVRQLTKIILADDLREEIYSSIIHNYAQFGLLNKAEKLAGVQLKSSLTRINSYSNITQSASWMNKKEARKYVDQAYKELQSYNGSNPDIKTRNHIQTYVALMHGYASIQDHKNLIKVKNELFTKLNNYPADSKPSRATNYATAYNAIGNASNTSATYQTIESNNLEEAITLLRVRKEAVDNALPSINDTNRNIQLLGYASQLMMIQSFYDNDKDGRYRKEIVEMTKDIQQRMYRLKEEADKIGEKDQDKFYYALTFENLISALYYVAGDEKAALDTYNMINPELVTDPKYKETVKGWKQSAAVELFQVMALKNGFKKAVKFLEKEYPLTNDTLFLNYMPAIIGVTEVAENNGYFYNALKHGKEQEAKEVLQYMYNKMEKILKDENAVKQLSKDAKQVLIKGTIYENLNKDITVKYIRNGITSLASAYFTINDKAKAVETLHLADVYMNTLQNSINKYENYMALANMAKIIKDNVLFKKYYDEALKMELLGNSSVEDNIYMYISKALDLNYFKAADRVQTVKDNLLQAENMMSSLLGDDKSYSNQVYYYTLIAKEYYNILLLDKAKASLLKAEESANKITNQINKQKAYKQIVKAYGSCEFIDEGYNKAVTLVDEADAKNRNQLIKELINVVSNKNDYNSNKKHRKYSFIDTDKDGKPDFFYPWISEEDKNNSGLIMDDDIDGDKINDDEDILPYVKQN